MASILRADELRNRLGNGPADLFMQEASKANINFNGTGTISIRRSLNVSSIVDGGTGDYAVNFTNAFSNSDFAAVASGGTGAAGGVNDVDVSRVSIVAASVRLQSVRGTSNAQTDFAIIQSIIEGDLA